MAAHESKIDPNEFGGKRCLVTGGTKGIGQAVTSRLREGGATVLTTARTRPSDLADDNSFIAADVTTPKGCSLIADAVLQRLGGIEEMKIVGGAHFLHRGTDEIVPQAARGVGLQVLTMRVKDE